MLTLLITGCAGLPDNDVDVDFTILSTTLIQAEYHRIGADMGNYIGKTMRMPGRYDPIPTDNGQVVHVLMLMDGDECCQMGVEFRLKDGEAYPAMGAMIEITGVLTDAGYGHVFLDVSALKHLGD